jgi:hypothetical protein
MAFFGRPSEQDDARAARWRDWLLRQHPLAIAALVLGVFSLTHLGTLIIDAVAAIVLGAVALKRVGSEGQKPAGRRIAWIGIVAAAVSLAISAALYAMRVV